MKLSLADLCRVFWDDLGPHGRRHQVATWLARWGQAIKENFPRVERCAYCIRTFDRAAWLALPVSRPKEWMLALHPHLANIEVRHCPCGASLTRKET